MILDYTNGCICTSLLVDDIETVDLNRESLINLAKTILRNITNEEKQTALDYYYEYYLYIEGISDNKFKRFSNFSLEEKKEAILKTLNSNKDLICPVQTLYVNFLKDYGTYKYLGRCNECGDTIENWTIEIF